MTSSSACFSGWAILSENPGKDFVDVAQLAFQIEGMLNGPPRNETRDLCVFEHQVVEVQVICPSAHGVPLDHPVSVLARYAVLHQIEQKLPAEDQTSGTFEVAHHALGIYEHCLDKVGCLLQHVIHQRRRVGNNDALDGRMGNVALVPECDVLKSSLRIGAHYARQSADLLAGYRVAFVGHGR